jgi:hypothetical protein
VYQIDSQSPYFNHDPLPITVTKNKPLPIILYDKEWGNSVRAQCSGSVSLSSKEMLGIYTGACVFAYAAAKIAYKKRRLYRTYWRRFGTVENIPDDVVIETGWDAQYTCESEGILDRKNVLFVKVENAERVIYGASSANLGADAYKLEKRW